MEETPTIPTTQIPPVNQQVTQDVPQQTEPQKPASPVKKRLPKSILITIILVIFIGLSGILVLKKNTLSQPDSTKDGSQKTTSVSPTTKPKQPGLATYTNSASKFSIDYPDDFQVNEKTIGMGVSTVELRSENNLDENYLADIQMMTIPNYLAKAIGQDFNEYYNMNDNSSKTITLQEKSQEITKVKNRTINDQRAFEFRSTDPSGENTNVTIGVYIEMGDKILIVSTQESNRAELEKMLENFTYNP